MLSRSTCPANRLPNFVIIALLSSWRCPIPDQSSCPWRYSLPRATSGITVRPNRDPAKNHPVWPLRSVGCERRGAAVQREWFALRRLDANPEQNFVARDLSWQTERVAADRFLTDA